VETEDAVSEPEDDKLTAMSVELEAARHAQSQAEHRAAEASKELRAIQSGIGWRALVAYRKIARGVAPTGSRRGRAYDLVTRTARRSAVRPPGAAPTLEGDAPAPPQDAAPAPVPPEAVDTAAAAGPPGADTWFADHYDSAAGRVIAFLEMDGITLEGRQVADIGAGDGILDLGLVHKAMPARLVGYDLNLTNADMLLAAAVRQGVCDGLPAALEFEASEPCRIPTPDRSFDVVVTWSAFEHIDDPLGVLREARRVVRDDGAMFLQVWPFYHSQFGSHLRDWFPDGWEHLEKSAEEIEATIRASTVHTPEWADVMLHEFRELNKVTVDDLGTALVEAGFRVLRLNLLTRAVPLPPRAASHVPLSALGIEGVELTAVPVLD
jgi:2-polyprenyl-3-methyl-5-hydroxy-6-metoxy-1,4-benzoquinol methylase